MDKQMSLSALNDELAQVRTKKKEFLEQIERIVPWGKWVSMIKPCYYKGERGNKPYDLELMLRLYLLQNLYNLSDEATVTEAIDSRAFSDFCGVDSSNQVPDGDTLGRFRNMLYDGNGAGMAFEPEDIQRHTGILGITREEWENVKDSVPVVATGDVQKRRENSFLNNPADSYAIYQLRSGDELRDYRFEGMEHLQKAGLSVERGNYEFVYTGALHYPGDTYDKLNGLYQTFNIDHPVDFTGHSLSVSDIVALKQDGVVSCHYVDSFGFQELPTFLKPENYLKNSEMAMEDDYGMLDGIINNGPKATAAELEQQAKSGQPISLLELAEAARREHDEKKKSVVERLRNQPVSRERKKTAPDRGAEMER